VVTLASVSTYRNKSNNNWTPLPGNRIA